MSQISENTFTDCQVTNVIDLNTIEFKTVQTYLQSDKHAYECTFDYDEIIACANILTSLKCAPWVSDKCKVKSTKVAKVARGTRGKAVVKVAKVAKVTRGNGVSRSEMFHAEILKMCRTLQSVDSKKTYCVINDQLIDKIFSFVSFPRKYRPRLSKYFSGDESITVSRILNNACTKTYGYMFELKP